MRRIPLMLIALFAPEVVGAYVYQGYLIYFSPFIYPDGALGTVVGGYGIWTVGSNSLEVDVHRVDMDGTRYTITPALTYGFSHSTYLRGGFNYSTNGNFVAFLGLKKLKSYQWNSSITAYFYRVGDEYLKALYLGYGSYCGHFYTGFQVNLTYSRDLYTSVWLNLSYVDDRATYTLFFKVGQERYPIRSYGFFLLDMPQDENRGNGIGLYFKYAFDRNIAIYLTGMVEGYSGTMYGQGRPDVFAFFSIAVGYSP